MRTLLLAGVAVLTLAGPIVGAAQAADLYDPGPGYSAAPPMYQAPPPNYAPPPAYQPPPRYGYVAPPPQPMYGPPPQPMYGPPPVVAYDDDDDDVMFAPRPPRYVYRDGPVYRGPPMYAARPHFHHCGSGWAPRRCGPGRGW